MTQKLPSGWTEDRIRGVVQSYDEQSEDDQAEEIERALTAPETTMMSVPVELVDEVRTLIAKLRATAS